jgi:hypothetical protein
MKTKIFLLLLVFFNALIVKATIHEVHVADFHFDPVLFNALVGDSVKFIWDNGDHTTTSSTIPTGAAAWDEPVNSSHTTFIYVITVAGNYTYFCKKHGDQIASFTATGTLPVQLTNLQVTNTKNNKALLTWSTVTEQNTSYFSIQISTDAKSFIEIARVNAAGNSSVLKQYNYTDNNISSNQILYYKIITVDKDGSKTSSAIIAFKNNLNTSGLVTLLSPNPVKNPCDLNVQFNIDQTEKIFIQIYNASGIVIKQVYINVMPGLNNQLHLNNLLPGVYTIKFQLHNTTDTKTLVVQ